MPIVRPLTWLLLLVTSLFPTYHGSLGVLAAAQTMPTATPSDRDRGMELLNQLKFKDLRSGAPDKALTKADEAIRLSPQLPAAHFLKSQSLVSIYGENVISQKTRPPSSELTPEERVQRRNILKQDTALLIQAAKSLETYLKLNPHESSVGLWQEQLATLRVFASYGEDGPKDSDGVFSGLDVTTKARVTAKPEPSYTEAARQAGVTGTVVLRCVFAADGTVRNILVLKGLPNGLTEKALEAARLIKFIPATVASRPVSMFIQLEYNFNLY